MKGYKIIKVLNYYHIQKYGRKGRADMRSPLEASGHQTIVKTEKYDAEYYHDVSAPTSISEILYIYKFLG